MTRAPGELPEPEELLLNIHRPTPEQEKAEEKRRAEDAELRRLFLVNIIGNPMFRGWLMEKLTQLGTFENRFACGPVGFPDPNATFFELGRKQAGLDLLEEFEKAAPDYIILMKREAAGLT